ncbi:uncharacterized protein MONOS_4463 [Monocercomonoides exilis]|uniref:uncharacterized protein n=1 Tax=Monocercomonoides exilis TaxID=2049356 RepID=UPI00355A819F|nr:hypothetical protein MONOS_4463 [Monocercomonoides exilis]|eukprot:MONOS_4463.1-p1 / transcript=MONOS_4463.1 / gene=MONOS_4463 / organism=Monocercomonoides_exilis_PA203 / gene_product=unspecified product / transcript_product=unspecified product / location=Mono_scaffold00119:19632-20135(-) / protein_length=168 / sequence_SO=supercontig / SO=protein_coding / is_pseudo=false
MERFLNVFVENRCDEPLLGLNLVSKHGDISVSDEEKPITVPPHSRVLVTKFSAGIGSEKGIKGKARFSCGPHDERVVKMKWKVGGKHGENRYKVISSSDMFRGLTPVEEHDGPNSNVTFVVEATELYSKPSNEADERAQSSVSQHQQQEKHQSVNSSNPQAAGGISA